MSSNIEGSCNSPKEAVSAAIQRAASKRTDDSADQFSMCMFYDRLTKKLQGFAAFYKEGDAIWVHESDPVQVAKLLAGDRAATEVIFERVMSEMMVPLTP